jgi:hypothetical protein
MDSAKLFLWQFATHFKLGLKTIALINKGYGTYFWFLGSWR